MRRTIPFVAVVTLAAAMFVPVCTGSGSCEPSAPAFESHRVWPQEYV